MAILADTTTKTDAESTCSTLTSTTAKPELTQIEPETSTSEPPPDPLLTPINIPTALLSCPAHNPLTSAPLPGTWKGSPLAVEETVSRAFVHAACRAYEVVKIATAVCNHFVHKWSGLGPAEAAATALNIENKRGKASRHQSTGPAMPIDAVQVQVLLSIVHLQMAMAGTAVGMVMDARAHGVATRCLLPLAALQDGDTTATAETLAALIHGTNAKTSITHFHGPRAELRNARTNLFGRPAYKTMLSWDYWGSSMNTLKHIQSYALSMKDPKAHRAIPKNMRYLIGRVIPELCSMVTFADSSLSVVLTISQSKLAWRARMHRKVSSFAGQGYERTYDEGLIEEARPACEQAKKALKAVDEMTSYYFVL